MLPHQCDHLFLTDGGLETTLVFLEDVELRDFAAFELLETAAGRARLAEYFRRHLEIAAAAGSHFVVDAPTWRASADWGARLGYDRADIERVNARGIELARGLRHEAGERWGLDGAVNGVVGPRGDGYAPSTAMTADDAAAYHRH